jgi:hypothetical protein
MVAGLIHTCTIQRRYVKQKFTYTGGTGTPVVGQTIVGGTSHKTAVIDQLFTGYLVVKNLSGTFTVGETIAVSTTFSATLSAVADFKNSFNQPEYYWMDDQVAVPCRFYSPKGSTRVTSSGEHIFTLPRVRLDGSVTIAEGTYQIVSTVTGLAGTFKILKANPRYTFGSVPDQWEPDLQVVD